jgi:cytosine/adenosine deaminase-related metal-dependent hydrolase
MRILTADYIFPVSGNPLKGGYLYLDDDGTILDLRATTETVPENLEKYKGILVPGFINAHCHLDLSHLKGRISQGWGLDAFIREIRDLNSLPISEEEKIEAAKTAEQEMRNNGIVGCGDITSHEHSLAIKAEARLAYYSFCEAFGSDPRDATARFEDALQRLEAVKKLPGQAGASVTPHATYSVSPELFDRIKEWAEENDARISLHHQENNDENRYFQNKGGPIVSRMQDFGVDIRSVHPQRKRPLPAILDHLPLKNPILLVHNTVSTPEDIHFAMSNLADPWWCLCPNANLYIENSIPNIPLFRPYSEKVCLGTDSLASNHQLSILSEMKTIQEYYPETKFDELLRWATLNGAKSLGMASWAGSFEKGKKPGVIQVRGISADTFTIGPDARVKVLAF